MHRRKISWSDLPSELLLAIANRLETRLDIFHFRVVCKDWHRSASLAVVANKNVLSSILPHKLTPLLKGGLHSRLERFYNQISVNHLILVASCIFLVKSTNENIPPWLMTVDELNPGKLCLRNPFSRSTVMKLPESFPNNLGLGRFDVVEMGKVYSLRFDEKCYDFEFEYYWKYNNLFGEYHKVVLLGYCETSSKIDDYTAVVLYGYGVLAAIKLENENVEEICFKGVSRFDDIVIFKGMVYVIDRRGRLYLMDKSGDDDRFKLFSIIQKPLKPGGERKSRLFESCGELYFVRRCTVSRPNLDDWCFGFIVYKLNQENKTWDEVDSIGNDRILFVTPDCCFFAPTSDFSGWKGNCIVLYSKKAFPSYADSNDDQSWYDFRLEKGGDKLRIEVFHFEDCKITAVDGIPHYYDVFWPPPQWISPDTCFPTTKFQGLYIRVELIPILETIWAKHGNVIGSDTVRRNKILASALEELAEFVIKLKCTSVGTLTDSQVNDLRSNLVDFQHQGLNVDWLVPIIDKAVMLHKDKLIVDSIISLDNEIGKLNEKKRDFLAQRAKLKEELKEDTDIGDFFGKVLR